ncbi:putative phage-type endonuclease [compost metagenome]
MIHTRAERLRARPLSSTGRAALHLVPTPQRPAAVPASEPRPAIPEAGVGALDAAAALGRDPFKSPVRLWMEKTGRQGLLHPAPREDEDIACWSRSLEPIVAAHYTVRTGRQIRRTHTTLQHPKHPWMLATVTREVLASAEVQLLECLCVGMNAAPLWNQGVPEHIRLRLLHLLAVTGQRAADVIVLLGGQDLQIYRIERDEAEIARLIRHERMFWRGVERDEAPPSQDEAPPLFLPVS